VQERVRQLAVSEGKEVNDGMEIGDVIVNLESSPEKGEKSPAAQAVKTAFGRTMGLIKTVGGIVADGASTVSESSAGCVTGLMGIYRSLHRQDSATTLLASSSTLMTVTREPLKDWPTCSRNARITWAVSITTSEEAWIRG
jgi:hypothetical protein